MKFRRHTWLVLTLFVGSLFACSACSPLYVIEAGWNEAGILLRREKISKIIAAPETESEIREKLSLVLAARDFSQSLGLEPGGSYLQYSTVDRDVLVWVLSACPKTSLTPHTWWFPIVGSVPYKGFFGKDDAIREAKRLKEKGFDVYLRPSAAFSTLGWFNDPLLSTMMKFPDTALANTVIHEILHNTIWIGDSVPFNESLANFVGSIGARDFFLARDGAGNEKALLSDNQWHDELLYAKFLGELERELEPVYANSSSLSDESVIAEREKVFANAQEHWKADFEPLLKTKGYPQISTKLNNAIIVADRIYLSSPELFDRIYNLLGASLSAFVSELKELEPRFHNEAKPPFEILQERIKELEKEKHGTAA